VILLREARNHTMTITEALAKVPGSGMQCEARRRAIAEATVDSRDALAGIAEFGVFRGLTAALMGILKHPEQPLYLFDSFQGNPAPGIRDSNNLAARGSCRAARAEAEANLTRFEVRNAVIYAGWLAETLPNFRQPIIFAHIDCDNHEATKLVLDHVQNYLIPKTQIIVDDYHPGFPGVMAAVDGFLKINCGWTSRVIRGQPHDSILLTQTVWGSHGFSA
jgi:Macrocin-O-methyltransferase (TylF)